MKEHIIKKLKENPEKTLNALKMLEIDLFQKHGGLNFESLLINMDDVFFEKFPNLIFL